MPFNVRFTESGIPYFAQCDSCKAIGFGRDGAPQLFMKAHDCGGVK